MVVELTKEQLEEFAKNTKDGKISLKTDLSKESSFEALQPHFKKASPPHAYLSDSPIALDESSSLHQAVKKTQEVADHIKVTREDLERAKVSAEDITKKVAPHAEELKLKGAEGHVIAQELMGHTNKMGEDLERLHTQLSDNLTKAATAGHLTGVEVEAARAKLLKEFEEMKAYRQNAHDILGKHREEIATVSGVPTKNSPTLTNVGSTHTPAKTPEGKLKPIHSDPKIAEQQFNEMKFGPKTKTRISHGWHSSGAFGKVARVVGTGLGVFLVGKGIKDLFVGKKDEQGQEIPDAGSPFVAVSEIAGGAALGIFSLVVGGKNAAIGRH